MKTLYIITILILIISPLNYSYAQETATISGKITREDGTPAVKITISIGDKFNFTDINGKYRIKDVPFGKQLLLIKEKGIILKEVDIDINKTNIVYDAVIKNHNFNE